MTRRTPAPTEDATLVAARSRLVAAATSAQSALVDLVTAADDHDRAVRHMVDRLRAAGRGSDIGQSARGTWWARVAGRVHPAVDAGTALVWVAHRVAAARVPIKHTLTYVLLRAVGRADLDRAGSPVADVPAVPADPDRPNPLVVRTPPVRGAPVQYASESSRRAAEAAAQSAYIRGRPLFGPSA